MNRFLINFKPCDKWTVTFCKSDTYFVDIVVCSFICFIFFSLGSQISQDIFVFAMLHGQMGLQILPASPPKRCDYRCTHFLPGLFRVGDGTWVSCMLGKFSLNLATCLVLEPVYWLTDWVTALFFHGPLAHAFCLIPQSLYEFCSAFMVQAYLFFFHIKHFYSYGSLFIMMPFSVLLQIKGPTS